MKKLITFQLALAISAGAFHSSAYAHFPWLVRGDQGKLIYYFGEDLTDKTYKMPESIAKATVQEIEGDGKAHVVELVPVESELLVGCTSKDAVAKRALFSAESVYGNYKGTKLSYTALHLSGTVPARRQPIPAGAPKLLAEVVDSDAGIDVYATYQGTPLAKTEVKLFGLNGEEKGRGVSDDEGKVTFEDKSLDQGLMAVSFGLTAPESGEANGAPYKTSSQYLTATFMVPKWNHSSKITSLPEIPFAITSFGAARTSEAIYLYGGHTGNAHEYSTEGQSNKLLKWDLKADNGKWEEISTGDRLQGLAMVAHGKKVILIGGFSAKNAEGADHDLHSQNAVKAFDTETKSWSDLPSLPEARSSHDAAILGDTIYVVGGWKMAGKESTQWQKSALALDLSAEKPEWKEIAEPPFVRRALATVSHNNQLFAIGGMNQKGGPTKEVWCYDPTANSWTQLASLLGDKEMAGFGASGWSIDNQLIVSTYEGDLQRWDDKNHQWQLLGHSDSARFFHRVLPLAPNTLVSIGGANMEEGKFTELETITLK